MTQTPLINADEQQNQRRSGGPIPRSLDQVVDMSVRYLMANTRLDFHVTASLTAEMERTE